MKLGMNIMKWVPPLAFAYAFYEYYADRGLDGIRKDLEAITIDGIKAKISVIVIGLVVIIGVDIASKYVKNTYLKIALRSIGYYVGAKQLATALRQGAGVRGGRGGMGRGIPSAGLRQAANPYMR